MTKRRSTSGGNRTHSSPHGALQRAVSGIAIVDASPTGQIGFATGKPKRCS